MTGEVQDRRITHGLVVAAIALHLWLVSVGWNNGFLPGNEFRQTHTAITALFIQRDHDFSLAYPTPLLGKPWPIPYEFPLYQWSVVGLSNLTGITLTQAARTVSCTCFYLALPAVWLLLGRLGLAGPRRWIPLLLVLTCPLYVFYARAFLIEMMALMFSLWFLAAYGETILTRRIGWLVVVQFAGIGAGLVKVTTFLLYLIPAAVGSAVWLFRARRDRRELAVLLGWMTAAVALPFAATLAWIHFADGVKAMNPSGRSLMSDAMNGYHFGNWHTRLTPELWATFYRTLTTNLIPLASLSAATVVVLLCGGRWWKWIAACLGLFCAGPLIFPLLYSWHEYYFSANGVCLMIGLGLACCALLESRAPRGVAWGLVVALLAGQLCTYRVHLYPAQSARMDGGSGLTSLLRDVTDPDDVLVIAGDDWAPMIPYYSQRRALMFRRGMDRNGLYAEEAFKALQGEKVRVLILRASARDNSDLLQRAVETFQLQREPSMEWEDARVYVKAELQSRIGREFHARPYGGVTLVGATAQAFDAFQFVEHAVATMSPSERAMFQRFGPPPVRYATRYPLGLVPLGDHSVLMAHPNSRLCFAPPAGRRRLTAAFGIMPGAYEHVPPHEVPLDGVTFSLVQTSPEGHARTLFTRFLDPRRVPSDRGTQSIEIPADFSPGDELLLITAPGPRGIYNRTWSYWDSLRIE